ncbi:hypothetical protein [Solicola sp. PLA-1-18]|uniref:hypothetical protein n=1 Tax=Solicola sp. PLA-1-18 TaxID=3380532 RepID=UPI003B7AABD5
MQIIPPVVPAVAFPGPPPGTVAVQLSPLDMMGNAEADRQMSRWGMRRDLVGAVHAFVPRGPDGTVDEIHAPELGGSIRCLGDVALGSQILQSARELRLHLVAIPELSRPFGERDDLDPHNAVYVTELLNGLGLKPTVEVLASDDAWSVRLETNPPEGSVVERGSSVMHTVRAAYS